MSDEVLKGANTKLADLGRVPKDFGGTKKTKFLSESAVNSLARAYMMEEVHEEGPTLEDDPFSEWPFRCVTIDALLVEIAKCLTEAARKSVPSRNFFCANSEATGSY